MKKVSVILLIAVCFSFVSGCWHEYREDEIEHIYKVDSLTFKGNNIIVPHVTRNPAFDAESRDFYIAADTSLVLKGYRHKADWWITYSAIDWRITKIDITALVDYDEAHLAGESLNDLFSITYTPRFLGTITIPVSEIGYGDIMLGYYVPGVSDDPCLRLNLVEGAKAPSKFEVRIEDAFGRSFVLR